MFKTLDNNHRAKCCSLEGLAVPCNSSIQPRMALRLLFVTAAFRCAEASLRGNLHASAGSMSCSPVSRRDCSDYI